MKFTAKKQLLLITLSISTLLPFSNFGMQAMTNLLDHDRYETLQKIHEATTPIQHSKFILWINNSKFILWINKKVSEWYSSTREENPIFNNHPFKKAFLDAQTDLGIPKEQQVPVIIGKVMYKDWMAQCTIDLITLNQYMTTRCPPAILRFTALHEAAHNKNLDCIERVRCVSKYVSLFAFRWLSFIAYGYKYFPVNMVKLFPVFTVFGIDALFTFLCINQNSKYQERRADTTAAYASKCHECVKIMALSRSKLSSNDPSLKHGYLSQEALNVIAEKLEQAGKKCLYHEESNKEKRKNELVAYQTMVNTNPSLAEKITQILAAYYSISFRKITDVDLKFLSENKMVEFFIKHLMIQQAYYEDNRLKTITGTTAQAAAAAARTQQ